MLGGGGSLTAQLNGEAQFTPEAEEQMYTELRRLIAVQLRDRSRAYLDLGTGMNLTVVVHEAWVKLQATKKWDSRAHFFGAASRAARQVLIDDARRRMRRGQPIHLHDSDVIAHPTPADVIQVDELLRLLEKEHPRASRVASMRLFGDFPPQVIAESENLSVRTVNRDLAFARAFFAAHQGDVADSR